MWVFLKHQGPTVIFPLNPFHRLNRLLLEQRYTVFCVHYIKATNKSCLLPCWPMPFLSRAISLLPWWLLAVSLAACSGSKMLPFCCGIILHSLWGRVQMNMQAANGDSHPLPTHELRSSSKTTPSLYINRIVYKIPTPLAYTNCVCQSF